ncbi:MAG: hypothetical protein KKB70_02195 [Proteobacteria bacterium]|nr:hypothetical protein [Pseudomonadota bacterium]
MAHDAEYAQKAFLQNKSQQSTRKPTPSELWTLMEKVNNIETAVLELCKELSKIRDMIEVKG